MKHGDRLIIPVAKSEHISMTVVRSGRILIPSVKVNKESPPDNNRLNHNKHYHYPNHKNISP